MKSNSNSIVLVEFELPIINKSKSNSFVPSNNKSTDRALEQISNDKKLLIDRRDVSKKSREHGNKFILI